jgi:subtilase family serine protease
LQRRSPGRLGPWFALIHGQPAGSPSGYSPVDLRTAYSLPSSTAGSGQTVAIVDAFDDPNAESDLGVYRSQFGIAACTTANGCFRKVDQSGGSNYPRGDRGWAEEISLDLDMVSAVCPNCHILLVEATTNSFANLSAAEDEAAKLGATEISNSWGGGEYSSEVSDQSHFNHPGHHDHRELR